MKIPETLWQCYKDHSVLTNTGAIVDFNSNNISDSFNLKKKQARQVTIAQKMLKQWCH